MKPAAEIMGFNNVMLVDKRDEILKGKTYKDSSLVIVTLTRGERKVKCKCGQEYIFDLGVNPNVVMTWLSLMMPLNNRYYRLIVSGANVADGYNAAVKIILEHPEIRNWKYMLTVEDDQLLQPDSLLKLINTAKDGDWDAVGGLIWMKQDEPSPMIYGDPADPDDFTARIPEEDSVMECNAMGMGFTLFNLDMFRDGKIEEPFFKTVEEWTGEMRLFDTQDLYFFRKAKKAGYRFAVDTKVKIGHLDMTTGKVY